MEQSEEKFFICPFCNQRISMVFESSYGSQSYIEDCEVCCNPIEVFYEINEGEITISDVRRAD